MPGIRGDGSRRSAVIRLLVAAGILVGNATAVPAQPPPAGWYLTPSFRLTEEYDSNVFGARSDEQADLITGLTPEISLGYRSLPLVVLGRYSLTAELYADNTDLNNASRNQRGDLTFRYRPERRLTLDLDAAYRRTDRFVLLLPAGAALDPADPGPVEDGGALDAPEPPAPATTDTDAVAPDVTSVDLGRRVATVVSVAPGVAYDLTPLTSVEGGYRFRTIDVDDAPRETEHTVELWAHRQLTRLDRGSVRYRLRHFESDDRESHSLTLGWTRPLTPRLSMALQAGPRIADDGDAGVEARAILRYRYRQAVVLLRYVRTDEIVAGRQGAQTVDRISARVRWHPRRPLVGSLTAEARFVSAGELRDVALYHVTAGLAYRLNRWLTARVAYRLSVQHDDVPDDIVRHVVLVGLELEDVFRLD
jgi:hypothetical protein